MAKLLVALLFLVCLSFVTAHFGNFGQLRRNTIRNKRVIADTCAQVTCLAPGASCNSSSTTFLCANSTCSNGTCVAPTGVIGALCANNGACISGSCINGKCNAGGDPGTPCTIDDQCVYYNQSNAAFAQCINNVCAGAALGESCRSGQCAPPLFCNRANTIGSSGVCASPRSVGEACNGNDDSQCAYPLVCYNSLCSVPLPLGSPCTEFGDSCANFSICTGNSSDAVIGNCIERFSLPDGAYTNDDVFCGDGLTFIDNDSCIKTPSNSSLLNCTNSDSSMCQAGEQCECNENVGYTQCIRDYFPTPIGLYSAYKAYYQCLGQCQANLTCFYANCLPQICALEYIRQRDIVIDNGILQPCMDDYDSPTPTTYIELYCAANPPAVTSSTSGSSSTTSGSTGTTSGSTGTTSSSSSSTSASTTSNSSDASFVGCSIAMFFLSFFMFL